MGYSGSPEAGERNSPQSLATRCSSQILENLLAVSLQREASSLASLPGSLSDLCPP